METVTLLAVFAIGFLAGAFVGIFVTALAVAANSTPDYQDGSGDYLGG